MYTDIIINYNDKKLLLSKIHNYTSIYGLKYKILKKYKIPIEDQILNLNGIRLKNNKSILHYNLDKNSIINIGDSKLKGGSWCDKGMWIGVGVIGGIFVLLLFIIPILPFLLHVYIYILKSIIINVKNYLCKYNRTSAAFIGLIIGIIVLTGFVYINNNNFWLFLYSLLFSFVFWLIGSKKLISFMEPMFRKECIYVDPQEGNIKECSTFSVAWLGFIPIYFISCIPYFASTLFMYLSVYVIFTCLSLAITNKYNCGSCNASKGAKKISKITTIVYIAIDILYRLPIIIYKFLLNLVQYTFPFVFLKIIYDSFKDSIENLIYNGKYYIVYGFFDMLGAIIPGIGLIFVMISTLMMTVHTFISGFCTIFYLVKNNIIDSNDYKYQTFKYQELMAKKVDFINHLNEIKGEIKGNKNDVINKIIEFFIKNGIKENGSELTGESLNIMKTKIETFLESGNVLNTDLNVIFNGIFKLVFEHITKESDNNLLGFVKKLSNSSEPGLQGILFNEVLQKIPNINIITDLIKHEDGLLYKLANTYTIKSIIYKAFICRFTCGTFRDEMKERNDILKFNNEDEIRELSDATGACKILQAVIVVYLFGKIMRGMYKMSKFIDGTYDSPRDMIDYYKVQNMAGTGAWFSWFVMILIYAFKHNI